MALNHKLGGSLGALECFLNRLQEGDVYALAVFAGRRMEVEVPFTGDTTVASEAMARWRPYGVTALHDAVSRLPEIHAPRGRPVAILITDGAENASELDPETARSIVRQADLPVYVLSLARGEGASGEDGGLSGYAEMLRELARVTGGGYLHLFEASGPEEACGRVLSELRARYVLGFPTAGEGESGWHRIEVEILRSGLEYTARGGYTGRLPK